MRILEPPFQSPEGDSKFKFVDLFAGIGGIRLPFQRLGGQCVFSSEKDKFAQKTYAANYGETPDGDITHIPNSIIPPHEVLLAGFPCQPFSTAGKKRGMGDPRGNMVLELSRILEGLQPKLFLLENVKGLLHHNQGQTLESILDLMPSYDVSVKVLNALDFGSPQNRERLYIVGSNRRYYGSRGVLTEFFQWPEPTRTPSKVGSVLEDLTPADRDSYTLSEKSWEGHKNRKLRHVEKGWGVGYSLFGSNSPSTNTITARYGKDGSEVLIDQSEIGRLPRRLTPRECARLQGLPENFVLDAVSKSQIYKQLGNSVCINVVQAIAEKMMKLL